MWEVFHQGHYGPRDQGMMPICRPRWMQHSPSQSSIFLAEPGCKASASTNAKPVATVGLWLAAGENGQQHHMFYYGGTYLFLPLFLVAAKSLLFPYPPRAGRKQGPATKPIAAAAGDLFCSVLSALSWPRQGDRSSQGLIPASTAKTAAGPSAPRILDGGSSPNT